MSALEKMLAHQSSSIEHEASPKVQLNPLEAMLMKLLEKGGFNAAMLQKVQTDVVAFVNYVNETQQAQLEALKMLRKENAVLHEHLLSIDLNLEEISLKLKEMDNDRSNDRNNGAAVRSILPNS